MEGLAQAAEVVTEPARKLLTDPAARAMGLPEGKPLGQMAEGLADSIGLPKPANEKERVVGDAARLWPVVQAWPERLARWRRPFLPACSRGGPGHGQQPWHADSELCRCWRWCRPGA